MTTEEKERINNERLILEIGASLNFNLNGDQNIGRVKRLCEKLDLNLYEEKILTEIGRMSVGYCQKTAISKSKLGFNKSEWAVHCKMGLTSFKKHLKMLVDKNIITVFKGSHFKSGGGSYPDVYGINFEISIKHKIYFNIDGIKLSKFIKPKASDMI